MTADQLVAALQMARKVEEARHVAPNEGKLGADSVDEPAAPAEENVTSLSSARHTK
jgi:hypothetical protein